MHIGFLFGFLYLVFTSNFLVSSVSAANLVLLAPMLIDGVTQRAGWRKSDNAMRFATGLLFGFGMAPFFGISDVSRQQSAEPYILFAVIISMVFILAQKRWLNRHMVRFFSAVSVVAYPAGLLLSLMLLQRFLAFLANP